jgi:hypothetical protein
MQSCYKRTGIKVSVPLMTVIIGSVPLLTGKIGPFLFDFRNNKTGLIPLEVRELNAHSYWKSGITGSVLLEVRDNRFSPIRGQEEQVRSY